MMDYEKVSSEAMSDETRNLPQRLTLDELGVWEATSDNPDDDEFTPSGLWGARDYNGNLYFTSAQELGVERWLLDNGYKPTDDNIHYERSSAV